MVSRLWNYLKRDKYLWIPTLPVLIYMVFIYLPIALDRALSTVDLSLPKFLKGFLLKIDSAIALAPIMVYLAFALFWKLVKDKTQELDKRIEQADQSIVRFVTGSLIMKDELSGLLDWADTLSFFGPLDDDNGFADTLLSKKGGKKIHIYDTYINSSKKALDKLLEAGEANDFKYNLCLYKQIVGTIIAQKENHSRQLFFFKSADSNELMGVILNKDVNVYRTHLEDDLRKGVGPAIDFNNQITNIRTTLDETLQKYWESMKLGWVYPVMPPRCMKGPWEHEILSFFHNTATTLAEKSSVKKIGITWRITDDSLDQARSIADWLHYLKTSFVDKGSVERVVLIDKDRYKNDDKYKNIVSEISTKYFSSLPCNYSIVYRNLSSDIQSDGWDFALFYNGQNRILAVQGAQYDPKHERLLRIYFARDQDTQKMYIRKWEDIILKEDLTKLIS